MLESGMVRSKIHSGHLSSVWIMVLQRKRLVGSKKEASLTARAAALSTPSVAAVHWPDWSCLAPDWVATATMVKSEPSEGTICHWSRLVV